MMGRPRTGDWLETEFCGLRKLGVQHVVSLLMPGEAACLDLGAEADICSDVGLAFTAFPIPDRGTPENASAFLALAAEIHARCSRGESAVVHCRAGIGRSGLLAAAVLLSDGQEPEDAFRLVSQARRVEVPDTEEQRQWLVRHGSPPRCSDHFLKSW